jgi:hypothetical protein
LALQILDGSWSDPKHVAKSLGLRTAVLVVEDKGVFAQLLLDPLGFVATRK